MVSALYINTGKTEEDGGLEALMKKLEGIEVEVLRANTLQKAVELVKRAQPELIFAEMTPEALSVSTLNLGLYLYDL
jgi:hypothetical protein